MGAVVRLVGITHRFGAVTALENVDLTVQGGSIHAVVGENGAGKTTLMRVLYGAIRPDAGTIEVDGAQRAWSNSADAIAHGIGMVSQHYSIIPDLTCLQNLILGAEGSFVLSPNALEARAEEVAKRLGFSFDWHAAASTLSAAGAQKLELVKLLWRDSKIMILDEPTAMLSPADAESLYTNLRTLADQGATVIVVTHRIEEVRRFCDKATVLRNGKKVADVDAATTSADELATLIVGHSIEHEPPISANLGEVLLDVHELSVSGLRGDTAVKSATIRLRQGEVVGLAGVDGSGQRELFHAIVGTLRPTDGTVSVAGLPSSATTRERIQAGLRLIPEDRHEEGVVEDWSIVDNAVLGLQRLEPLASGSRINLSTRRAVAQQIAERFNTRFSSRDAPMRSLSGGNQQRFVAARALALSPRVILAFQPARGLDIDATRLVYKAIRDECRDGACALVVGFDLDELIEQCDRVLVIHNGVVTDPGSKSRQEIGRLMVGAT